MLVQVEPKWKATLAAGIIEEKFMIRRIYIGLLLLRLCQLDLTLLIVYDLPDLDAAQVVLARNTGVVVEQVPLALELRNRVVCSPTLDRLQNAVLVCERTKRRIANGVCKVVGVAGGVREVVLALVLVHPGCFKEAAVVLAGVDWLAVCVVDDELLHVAGESVHVVAQFGHARHQSRLVAAGFHGLVGVTVEFASPPALELAAPNAAKVEIGLAIVVDEARRVDAVAAGNVVVIRLERTLWRVGDSDTNSENTLLVSGRKVEVEFSVLLGSIRSPELLVHPWDVLCFECDAVVGDRAFDVGHGEDVVVVHVILVAIVVVLDISLPIVGRVDVQLAIEDMSAGVSCEEMGDNWAGIFLCWVGHVCGAVGVCVSCSTASRSADDLLYLPGSLKPAICTCEDARLAFSLMSLTWSIKTRLASNVLETSPFCHPVAWRLNGRSWSIHSTGFYQEVFSSMIETCLLPRWWLRELPNWECRG